MKNTKIAFIGAGNMAGSLIGGLIADGFDPQNLWASALHEESLEALGRRYGINTSRDNNEVVKQADVIAFAVKPQVLPEVAKEISETVQKNKPLVISIAAGVREADIQRWLGENVAVVRCMPNTPALVGSGATGMYANDQVSESQKDQAESIMRSVGIAAWIDDEKQMDTVTALSGSGPAYFFMVMEILENAAVQMGLSKDIARLLIVQTALGAGRMALEVHESTGELRKQVTSPGGTTEAALEVLEEGDVRSDFAKALVAATKRAEEIADSLGKL